MSDQGSKSGWGAVGHVIGNLFPLALMAWAATGTSGALRVLLIAWVAFAVAVQVAVAYGWRPPTTERTR